MTRKTILGTAIGMVALVAVCAAGRGDIRRKAGRGTTRVTVDGASFDADGAIARGATHLRFGPGKAGIDLPGELLRQDDSGTGHAVFPERLAAAPPRVPSPPRPPAGLAVEHTLRMDSERGPVDLATGRFRKGGPVRYRLLASGWKLLGPEAPTGNPSILQSTCGKETMIVCLDEAEGKFLLFRELAR